MPKGLQGFQPGHPPFWTRGNPDGRGNRTTGADRAPQCGFQKGHQAFYRGGSVPGHAPTNPGGNAEPMRASFMDPANHFGHGRKAPRVRKDKQRECLEAIQNGKDDAQLERNFPEGMIRRLRALHDTAEDPTHRDFMNAQRLVLDILRTLKGSPEDAAPAESRSITLFTGTANAPPLPGTAAVVGIGGNRLDALPPQGGKEGG